MSFDNCLRFPAMMKISPFRPNIADHRFISGLILKKEGPSLVFNVVFCSSLFVLFIIVFSALLLVPAFYYSCGILPMYDGDRP
jgi:hypothetical protein